ncbi:hypothetical protein [Spiroplasma endosymbiont of Amphibalanus improvisus]|uniref:hypothetical protein n=1 Tax=Spiroplasma endosymbiont of Amphibalanus improvisus TaxID=3066327 RepID=UPI00313B6900
MKKSHIIVMLVIPIVLLLGMSVFLSVYVPLENSANKPVTVPVNTTKLKESIDNNGNVIMLRSKDYDFAKDIDVDFNNDVPPASTPAENEQNFTNWFSSQVDAIGGFSGTAVDTDYTVQILDNNNDKVNGNSVYQGWGDSQIFQGGIILKEVEITPVSGSQYITGSPVKFYLIIAPYLSYSSFNPNALPEEDRGTAPITALNNVEYDGLMPIMNLTNIYDSNSFLTEFLKLFTHNLIGWDLYAIENHTRLTPLDLSLVTDGSAWGVTVMDALPYEKNWFGFDTSTDDKSMPLIVNTTIKFVEE